MSTYENFFLKNYPYFTYVYIVSKLDEYNKNINEKYDDITRPLYQGKSDFNDKLISEILNNDFLDNNKLQCISMMIEYMLYWTSKNISIKDANKRFNFINYFMKNVEQVLPNMIFKDFNSVHGYVVFSDFIKVKNKLVIKTPKTNEEIRDMLFEYYIGSKFLNKLRSKTPNFMYTYGIFMCDPLINSNNKKLNVQFCNDNNKNNIYVLFEKIDGLTLHDYIQQIKTENGLDIVVNNILQIILSLDIAQKEGQYSHNDLHTDNVMMRIIKSPLLYEYLIGKYKYKMKLDYIATIIDYGMNRYVENGIPLGISLLEPYNVIPYKNTVSSDIFKLLISCIFSIIVFSEKQPKIYTNLKNKIDEVLEFLISFFRNRYQHDVIKIWDDYLLNKNTINFNKFKQMILQMKNNYYYPIKPDYTFYNLITPENFIEHVKSNMPDIWNKHVNETIINENEIIQSYIKVFDPQCNEEDFEDYLFSQCYKNIYMSDFVEQKKTFYQLFNKELKNTLTHECLTDQESMIINFNNINDCKNIINLFDSKSNEKITNVIKKFENNNIKNIEKYYENDIDLLNQYIKEMNEIYSKIDINLFSLFKNPNFVKISMEFFNEDMKKQIRNMYNFLNVFEKYLTLTSFSIDLKNIATEYLSKHKFNFDLFLPQMKYFEIALILSECINKYNIIISEYYCTRLNEETNKNDTYTLYNLIVQFKNMNPHFSDLYDNFVKSYLNIKIDSHYINSIYYVPVNSNLQIKTFLSLKNSKITSLLSLISRFVNYDNNTLKKIISNNKDIKTDIEIYNELRKNKKIKDPIKKIERNKKRANELFNYIQEVLKLQGKVIGGDYYFHLDYGGNDGGVASEFAKIMKLKNTQVYSADVENWLGNVKNNVYNNITYTLLSENQKLPYHPSSFDSVSCLQVLHHVEFIDSHLKELYRILKPNGILVIKEHDCNDDSMKLLIDIEHVIHEYVEPEIPNTKILNTYNAFYKSFGKLDKILKNIGFEFFKDSFFQDIRINPTRYYFAVYIKK